MHSYTHTYTHTHTHTHTNTSTHIYAHIRTNNLNYHTHKLQNPFKNSNTGITGVDQIPWEANVDYERFKDDLEYLND